MNKTELKKQKKRSALYQTAFDLFTSQGIKGTTISDIVQAAGVAKGTFYLYFKDKYDIRNKLIAHKAGELLCMAHEAIIREEIRGFEARIHFLVDHVLDRLENDPSLMAFIYKNLSWGIFIDLFEEKDTDDSYSFKNAYEDLLSQEDAGFYDDPELLLFSILELVSGTGYSCIVDKKPIPLSRFRPYLHRCIDGILESFRNPS